MYNDDETIIQQKMKNFEDRFFQPKGKNDLKTLHNVIIKSAMEFNQSIASDGARRVRKEKTIFENDEKTSNGFSPTQNNSSGNDCKKPPKKNNYSKQKVSHSYGTALLLSRIAYILAGMAIQHAEQERNTNRENKNHPRFAAKSKQIHHEPERPRQEPVQI